MALVSIREWCDASVHIEGRFLDSHAFVWQALLDYQKQNKISGNVLEIGALFGRSAAFLGYNCDTATEKLYVADIKADAKLVPNIESVYGKKLEPDQIMELDSYYFPQKFLIEHSRQFRFIHIDGEHTSEAVTNDLDVARKLIRKDGIIVLDDFLNERFLQIADAVFSWVKNNQYEFHLFAAGDNKGYITSCRYAGLYLAHLRKVLPPGCESPPLKLRTFKSYFLNQDSMGIRFANKPTRSGQNLSQRPEAERNRQ